MKNPTLKSIVLLMYYYFFQQRRRRINTQKMGLFAFRECEPAHRRIMNASTFLPIFLHSIYAHCM